MLGDVGSDMKDIRSKIARRRNYFLQDMQRSHRRAPVVENSRKMERR
jgi:hypothetical protein